MVGRGMIYIRYVNGYGGYIASVTIFSLPGTYHRKVSEERNTWRCCAAVHAIGRQFHPFRTS